MKVLTNEVYFLIGQNSVHDIGRHESHEAALRSDVYHAMGGETYGQHIVNRQQAYEVMRQLRNKLEHYDNSDCKQ